MPDIKIVRDAASPLHAERDGQTFYFCSDHRRQWAVLLGAAGGVTASLIPFNVWPVSQAYPAGFESKCNSRNKAKVTIA
jgi:hypothetical protein